MGVSFALGRARGRSGARGRGLKATVCGVGAGRPAGHLNSGDCQLGARAQLCILLCFGFASGIAGQDAVFLGAGRLVPPRLLQGQLVRGPAGWGAPGQDGLPLPQVWRIQLGRPGVPACWLGGGGGRGAGGAAAGSDRIWPVGGEVGGTHALARSASAGPLPGRLPRRVSAGARLHPHLQTRTHPHPPPGRPSERLLYG